MGSPISTPAIRNIVEVLYFAIAQLRWTEIVRDPAFVMNTPQEETTGQTAVFLAQPFVSAIEDQAQTLDRNKGRDLISLR